MTHINFLSENTANTPQNSGGGTSQYCVSRSEGAQGNVQRDNVQRTKDFWTLSPSGERAMSERRASDDREADQVHRRVSGGQSRLMSQSGCSAVDVPMTSYGAPDEHPMSTRSASDERRWKNRGWKYVAMIFAVLVMSIANVGMAWGTDFTFSGVYNGTGNGTWNTTTSTTPIVTVSKSIGSGSKIISCVSGSGVSYPTLNGASAYIKFAVPAGYRITNVNVKWMSNADGQKIIAIFGQSISDISSSLTTATYGGHVASSAIASKGNSSCDGGHDLAISASHNAREVMLVRQTAYKDANTSGNTKYASFPCRLGGTSGDYKTTEGAGSSAYIGEVVLTVESTAPSFSVDANAELVQDEDEVTLTSAGTTIYYKWSTNASAYAANAGSTLAAAADGSGASAQTVTAPNGTGTYYLYAVAKDESNNYSAVVKRSYTITAAAVGSGWGIASSDNSWTASADEMSGSGTVTKTLSLSANADLQFKIVDISGNTWYGNGEIWGGTKTQSVSSTGTENNCHLLTTEAGSYTFSFNTSTKDLTITYPNSYTFYYANTSSWSNVYVYKFTSNGSTGNNATWPGVKIATPSYTCGGTDYYAATSDGYAKLIFTDNSSQTGDMVVAAADDGKYVGGTGSSWSAFPTYSVTYNANGDGAGNATGTTGSVPTDASSPYACGSTVTVLGKNTLAKAGYTFAGWNTAPGGGGTSYAADTTFTISANTTLYAQWEQDKYTVTYNVNGGGSVTPTSATQATGGASLILPTPTWSGYTFEGWYSAGTKIGNAGASYTPTANITLYAHWTDNISGKVFSFIDNNYGDKFKAFDLSGWVTSDASKKDKTYTNATTGVQLVIDNGTWETKSNAIAALVKLIGSGTNVSDIDVIIPTGKIATVKISYGAYGKGDDFRLTVNSTAQANPDNKLDNGDSNAEVISHMKEITLNNQTGTLQLGISNTSKNNYIGRVSAVITGYTISYAAGTYGSGSLDSGTKTAGSSFTLSSSSSAFTRDGYVYDGWSTNSDGSTKDYNLGGTYSTDAAITLYPHWVEACSTPAAPTGFSAGSISATGATFTITDAADAASYDIYYSTSSTAPTSGTDATTTSTSKTKEVTGLTAATTYYAWVRSVCDASHKSAWVALNPGGDTHTFATSCVAPTTVNVTATVNEVSGFWFYPDDDVVLTAAPTGTPAGSPVTYQWKKNGADIDGATSSTYTIDEAAASDAGKYTCTISYGACSTTSAEFELKCMQFYLKNSGGSDISNHALTKVDATHATLSLSLTGGTTYKFRVTDGCNNWYGNSDETGMTSSNCSNWTMPHDADCKVTTSSKSATYTFNFDFSAGLLGSEMKVSVVYPAGDQAAGKVIYWDNSVLNWASAPWYRIGKGTHNNKTQMTLVPGTANLYKITTAEYNGFEYWHIANNEGEGTGNIFWTKDSDPATNEAITAAMGFEGSPVTADAVTFTPTSSHATGSSSENDNCEFYEYGRQNGMKTDRVTISDYSNGTITVNYVDTDEEEASFTSGYADLAHTVKLTSITAVPNTGYDAGAITINDDAYETNYVVTANTTIAASFTPHVYSITYLDKGGSAFSGSHADGYPTTHTYATATTLKTASKTGYTFDGWYGNSACTGSPMTSIGATSITADITLYAKWTVNSHTLTWNLAGGTVTTTGTQASEGATGSPSGSVNYGTTVTAPVVTKAGYTFNAWSPTVVSPMPDEDKTYMATWTAKQTTITIDANTANHGSTTPGTVTATYGSELPSFTAATGASGWNLTGYFTAATSGTKVINADGTLVASTDYADGSGNWKYETATLTLYPQYEEEAGGGDCEELFVCTATSATACTATTGSATYNIASSGGGSCSIGGYSFYIKPNSNNVIVASPKEGKSFAAGDSLIFVVYNPNATAKTMGFVLASSTTEYTHEVAAGKLHYFRQKLAAADISVGKVSFSRKSGDDRWIGVTIKHCETASCSTPTAPTATSNGATAATTQVVSWTDESSDKWDVYVSTSSSAPAAGVTPTASGLTAKTYTFTGLTASTAYYWWVRSVCDDTHKSSWFTGSSFTTSAAAAGTTYYLVTSTAQLNTTDTYVIMDDGKNAMMGVYGSDAMGAITSGFTAAADKSTVTVTSSDVNTLTLQAESSAWNIVGKDDQKLTTNSTVGAKLYGNTPKANSDTKDDFVFEFGSGKATIKRNVTTDYHIYYTSGTGFNQSTSSTNIRLYTSNSTPVYTVTYDLNGGTGTVPTNRPEKSGTSITLASSEGLTKSGFTFDGWLCSVNSTKYNAGASYTMTAENTTFTAQWVADGDVTPPTLSSSTPANSATNVAVSGNIVLTFSENVSIVDVSKFTLTGGAGTLSTGSATVSGATVTIPYSGLANSTEYTFSTAAGAVQDGSGNANAALSNIVFTTVVAPVGAPVITDQPDLSEVSLGETASFSLTATGATSYQWYSCDSEGENRVEASGESATTDNYSYATTATGTTYYICKVSNASGDTWSEVVGSIVNPVSFTIHYEAGSTDKTEYTTETFTQTKEVNDEAEDYISTLTKFAFNGVEISDKGKKGTMSMQISMPTSEDAGKYVSFTFTVAPNYYLSVDNIDIRCQPVGNDNHNYKVVLTDALGTTITGTSSTNTKGELNSINFPAAQLSGKRLVGLVTVKIFGWYSSSDTYRLAKNTYITGTVSSLPAPTASWTARPASATVGDGGKTYTLTTDGTNTVAWSITDQSGATSAALSSASGFTTTLGSYTTAGSLYVQASVTGDGIHYLSTPATLLRQRVVISADCEETTLISATLSSCTGTGDVTGTPGGTSTVAFESCESLDGGYKMGKDGSYMRLALTSGNFKANDEVKITITKASDQGDGALHIYKYASETWTELGSVAAAGAGTYTYRLTESNVSTSFNTIGLYRTGKNQNPYVKALSVVRNSCSASKPSSVTVTADPAGPYAIGATPTLTVSADNADTYQWYSNTNNTASDGFLLVGETATTYSPSTAIAGTTYYYCVATNESGSTVSNIITVTVNSAKTAPTVSWTDTNESPKYGGGGYAVKATVSTAEWDGTLTTDMLTASDGVTLTGVSVAGKVITATYGVTETARSPLSFSLTLPETTNYTALAANKEISFERCDEGEVIETTETPLPVLKNYTYITASSPNYSWQTAGVGWLTLVTGSSSIGSESDSYSGFSYRSNSGKTSITFYSELDAVTAVRVYIKGGGPTTLSKVQKGTTLGKYTKLTPSTDYDYLYSNGSSSIVSREQGYIEISFKTALSANTFVEITLSRNTEYYGVGLITVNSDEVGDIPTALSWATEPGTTVNKYTTDANFRYEAVKASDAASQATLGTISYKSSNPAVATVSATGVVDVLGVGNTIITATLSSSGCYKKATKSYTLNVAASTCTDVAGTITASGEGITIDGNTVTKTNACAAVTLTVSGHTGEDVGATYQWYQDGVSMGESYRSNSISVTANGDYTVEVTNAGDGHCTMPATNTITITGNAISITNIVDEWYVKNGRRTPDIALATIEGTTSWKVNDGSADIWVVSDGVASTITGFGGCQFELRDGIVYLKGTQDDGSAPSGLAAGDVTLTITAVSACGDDPTATITIHKQAANASKPSIAFIVDGTKGDPVNNVATAKTSSRPIWIYLSESFDLTGCNAYWTNNEKLIRQYYSQFDAIVITDDPSTDEKPSSGLKYVNALGTMVDVRPILTMEAYVGKYGASSNWHIGGTPSSPNPRQYELKLQCKDHDIFSDLTPSANFRSEEIDGETYYYVTMVDNSVTPYAGLADDAETGTYPALQGFSAASIKGTGMLGIGTISDGTLQGGVERQDEPTARMMILGIQHQAMAALTSEGKQVIKNAINYLLKTDMEEVDDCSNYFVGGTVGHEQEWHTASNWSSTKVPDASTKARILVPVTISTKVHVAQVDIAVGGKSKHYNSGNTNCRGSVTIDPTGALIVDGQVRRTTNGRLFTEDELEPTTPADLTILSSSEAQGALIFDNSDGDTQATVQMYSKASGAPNDCKWQWIATPFSNVNRAIEFYYGAWMYEWDNATHAWTQILNDDPMEPFKGYSITQEAAGSYWMNGVLASTENREQVLRSDEINGKNNGINLIGNSWTAPIQIGNFEAADFTNAHATIFILNTGLDVDGTGAVGTNNSTAGQYISIPVEASALMESTLKVIPAMQAFQVKAHAGGGSLNMDYDRLVRNDAMSQTQINEPMRAPDRQIRRAPRVNKAEVERMHITIRGSRFQDEVYIFAHPDFTEGFDNGWDGEKIRGASEAVQLFVRDATSRWAVAAVPTFVGTYLATYKGEDNEYTISFDYSGDETLYWYDTKTDIYTEINAENTYTYTTDVSTIQTRFMITNENPKLEVPTGVESEKATNTKTVKFIDEDKMYIYVNGKLYDATGKVVK